ncbi:hypothetical protein HYALB_00001357 [Hymenoscyphus albidus]|uniref:Uncharacterized protein n=1 Tax=Hymenoscyphus albidus TaxID=595503 RepID=A0A9N9LI06_9HELO|nr:hypothetical protein HYALB_00001357 [Hymenoscyphus albidus]
MDNMALKPPYAGLAQRSRRSQCDLEFIRTTIKSRTLDECEFINSEIEGCIMNLCLTDRCDIVNTSLDKSELRDTIISKSIICYSILYDCTVVDCEVLNCKLVNCQSINTPPADSEQDRRLLNKVLSRHLSLPHELPCFAQYVECRLRDCKVQNIKLRWSTVNGGSFAYCRVYFCDFEDSRLKKLQVDRGTSFANCTHDNRLIGFKHPPSLDVLPVEVRQRIFGLVTEWTGRTPSLIIALRASGIMYNEALDVSVRDNYFTLRDLDRLNTSTLPNMSTKTLGSIQRLLVCGFNDFYKEISDDKTIVEIINRGVMVNYLLDGKKNKLPPLEHLRDLRLREIHDHNPDDFGARIDKFIELAQRYKLEKLSISIEGVKKDHKKCSAGTAGYKTCEEVLNTKIWEINARLGIPAKNEKLVNYSPTEPTLFHPPEHSTKAKTTFTWQAAEDFKLEWKIIN